MRICGIGSRKTPENILSVMTEIGYWARDRDILIHSGHADGADYAFELGARENTVCFLPWQDFNSHLPCFGNQIVVGNNENLDSYVDSYHPAPDKLSHGARKLMRRNVCQVLGQTLSDPVSALVCWTQNGKMLGGTSFPMRIAKSMSIPVYNLASMSHREILTELENIYANDSVQTPK